MYNHIFVAGTFDHLHEGHKNLLKTAVEQGREITIGITSDEFVNKFKQQSIAPPIQPFTARKETIENWLKINTLNSIEIIPINDPYEPAASGTYDALIVTSQNKKTGEEINQKRKVKGLSELVLVEVPLVMAEDNKVVSSTRIRSHEIDSNGRLVLPQALREALKAPLGPIISEEELKRSETATFIITVGDVTTDLFLTRGIVPNISIIDLFAQRKPYKSLEQLNFPPEMNVIHVSSGPGFISHDAIKKIKNAFTEDHNSVIIVQGEDDLLVLPVIDIAPIGSVVYYGQPNAGLVEVYITEVLKRKILQLLQQFTNEG